jgi:hypothetical protein
VVRSIAVVVVIIVVAAVWRLAPLWTGPTLPTGATRLHIVTQAPHLTFGCAAAALSPVRVATDHDDLVLVSVESGETIPVVWPSGFGAWRIDGRAVVADPWGTVIGRDGDVLDNLSGGDGGDGAFGICPFGIVPAAE